MSDHHVRYIKDLSEAEKFEIKEVLLNEKFTNCKINNEIISFQDGIRCYDLRNTDIYSEDGLQMYMDLVDFLEKNYSYKPKYSTTLNSKIKELGGDVDAACEQLAHWKIKDSKYLSSQGWEMELNIDAIYSVEIKGNNHLIVETKNEDDQVIACVFQGEMSNLWSMISTKRETLFENSSLGYLLNNISQKLQ